ncbi:MAG TPA: glycosyltransferase, partial [Holophagaceae bacterium]|nr:glycosyltransferase [Holophagaceae bacterium]
EDPRPVPGPRRTLLYLGRLHPVKGIDRLLRAWARLEAERPDWDLRILGPDNGGHLAELQRLAAALGLRRAAFGGPVYGAEKVQAYLAADLFVLPTHSENFGMTVAEALAAGTPAVVTRGAPWEGLVREGAGWWIDPGTEALEAALREATALAPARREAMGRAGRAWMARDFAWDAIGRRMAETYRWLREGGAPPPWVRMG